MTGKEWKNKLYFGDNLNILREHVLDESVDLIYLDPPFNSKATYNVLFQEKNGTQSAAQITAFEDTWHWGIETEEAFQEIVKRGGTAGVLLNALRQFLGSNDMMAYLTMMAIRLAGLRRVLKPTGSIYLHCDPTASHYIKLLLDGIFGAANFQNEIVWRRTSAHSDSKRYGRVQDTIFFYSRSTAFVWNPLYCQHSPEYIEKFYRYKDPVRGCYRRDHIIRSASMGPRPNLAYEYKGYTPEWGWRVKREKLEQLDKEERIEWSKTGRPYLRRFLSEMKGTAVTSIWDDILAVQAQSKERLGYPTQKPEALLERIITASSNEGDVVLDPFCGCGTAIAVAERLHRRWIGIDITHLAVTLMRHRLHDTFANELSPYEVIGDPKDLASARALAKENRYQFEWWTLGLVEARPAQDKKKGADTGIDGHIYFFDDLSGKAKKIVVQVKSGHVSVPQIRDLNGVLKREKAAIGAFVTLKEPTRPMLREAATAGFYEPEYLCENRFPRLQILTIEELLAGKKVEYPRLGPAATFKKAERKNKKNPGQMKSLLDRAA